MSPEIVISHVVEEETEDEDDGDQLGLVSDCHHEHHWQTEQNRNHLQERINMGNTRTG